MSSFGDTFTKNSESEELLNYDDQAAYYFGATALCCVVVPWTYNVVKSAIWGNREDNFQAKTKLGKESTICRVNNREC
jgi:hypothetical protein